MATAVDYYDETGLSQNICYVQIQHGVSVRRWAFSPISVIIAGLNLILEPPPP